MPPDLVRDLSPEREGHQCTVTQHSDIEISERSETLNSMPTQSGLGHQAGSNFHSNHLACGTGMAIQATQAQIENLPGHCKLPSGLG